MVFPTCDSISSKTGIGSGCKINVVYNQQKPLCDTKSGGGWGSGGGTGTKRNCRMPDELCSADPDFKFDFSTVSASQKCLFVVEHSNHGKISGSMAIQLIEIAANHMQGMSSVEISSLFPGNVAWAGSILLYDTSFNPAIPIPIRIGDIDLDGFPDFIPIIVRQDPDGSQRSTPEILISKPCKLGANGCSGNWASRRTFEALMKDVSPLRLIKDARGVALMDVDEDVSVSFFVAKSLCARSLNHDF